MPPRPRRTGFARRTSSRRKLVWATSSTLVSLGASPTFNNIDLLANLRVAGSSVLGATIMRTHLTLMVDNTGRAVTSRSTFGLVVEDLENVGGVVDLASNPGRTGPTWSPGALSLIRALSVRSSLRLTSELSVRSRNWTSPGFSAWTITLVQRCVTRCGLVPSWRYRRTPRSSPRCRAAG